MGGRQGRGAGRGGGPLRKAHAPRGLTCPSGSPLPAFGASLNAGGALWPICSVVSCFAGLSGWHCRPPDGSLVPPELSGASRWGWLQGGREAAGRHQAPLRRPRRRGGKLRLRFRSPSYACRKGSGRPVIEPGAAEATHTLGSVDPQCITGEQRVEELLVVACVRTGQGGSRRQAVPSVL